jgi:ferredoxin
MPKIVVNDGPTFEVENGTRLVRALEDNGVDTLHRCGGYAKCTTCRVVFGSGEPDTMTIAERDRLADAGLIGEYRLSCQILCDHDMTLLKVNRLSNSDYDSPGHQPESYITPEPRWVPRPR